MEEKFESCQWVLQAWKIHIKKKEELGCCGMGSSWLTFNAAWALQGLAGSLLWGSTMWVSLPHWPYIANMETSAISGLWLPWEIEKYFMDVFKKISETEAYVKYTYWGIKLVLLKCMSIFLNKTLEKKGMHFVFCFLLSLALFLDLFTISF